MNSRKFSFARDATSFLLVATVTLNCSGDQVATPTAPIASSRPPVVLSASQSAQIESVESNKLVFSSASTIAAALRGGDVLAAPPSPQAPDGLLRRVLSKTNSGGKIIVETESARITDAVENGTARESFVLTIAGQAAVLGKGALLTGTESGLTITFTDFDVEGVRLNGSVSVEPTLDLSLTIKDRQVADFQWSVRSTFTSSVSAKSPTLAPGQLETFKSLGTRRITPVVLWIGVLPVVVTPRVEFRVGMRGEVTAEVSLGMQQKYATGMGGIYKDGRWTEIREFSDATTFDLPTKPKLEADFRLYAGPRFSLSFYGLTDLFNAYAALYGYGRVTSTPLAADTLWKLSGGVDGNVGLSSTVFDPKFVNFSEVTLFSIQAVVASGLRMVERVVVTPSTTALRYGTPTQLSAKLYDATGKELTRRVTWTSSNPSVARVDSTGMVTPSAYGTTTISAAAEGKTGTATLTMEPLVVQLTAPLTSLKGARTTQVDASGTYGYLTCSTPTTAVVTGGGLGTWNSYNWDFRSSVLNESKSEPYSGTFTAGSSPFSGAFYTYASKDGKPEYVPFSVTFTMTYTDLVTNARFTTNSVTISCT